MKIRKIALSCIFILFLSPLAIAGQKYQYMLHSENDLAYMMLFKLAEGGKHQFVAGIGAMFAEDEQFRGYAGNIAVTKKDNPELEFPGLAKKLASMMVEELDNLEQPDEDLKAADSEFSMLISVAGYETIEGGYPDLFPAEVTERRDNETKENVSAVFTSAGMPLLTKAIRSSSDQDLILQLARGLDSKPHLTVFKATYDILYLMAPGSIQPLYKKEVFRKSQYTNDDYERKTKNLPSGGPFSIGFMTSRSLFSKKSPDRPCFGDAEKCAKLKQISELSTVFKKDLTKHINRHFEITEEEVAERYYGAKRNNELGKHSITAARVGESRDLYAPIIEGYMIKDAQTLVTEITRAMPILDHELQKYEQTASDDICEVYVIGSYDGMYQRYALLKEYMESQEQKYNFKLKYISEADIENHLQKAVIDLYERLGETDKD